MWKVLCQGSTDPLAELFNLSGETRTRGHNFKLVVPSCRTEVLRRFFAVRPIATWNALPASVVEASCLTAFKVALDDALKDSFYRVL